MTNVTILLAIVFAILSVTRKNSGSALGILIFSMFIWPEYLRFHLGLMTVSIPRLVGIILLVKYLVSNKYRINHDKIDTAVILGWVWIIIASLLTGADSGHISQMIGRGLDTVIMYFVARYSIQNELNIRGLYKWIVLTVLTMFILSVYESITTFSPYRILIQYREWTWITKDDEFRLGLMRAKASTSVHIYFGMAMVAITGLLWSIRDYVNKNKLYNVVVVCSFISILTSLSSGPWLAAFMFIGFHFFYNRSKHIKKILYLLIVAGVFLEIASNRHFYNLIDYIALDSSTAWYRTRLLEVAFANLNEFWMLGVGNNWPHHWAAQLDGRRHIDIVNHFLLLGLYGGIFAIVMYIYVHIRLLKITAQNWGNSLKVKQRSLLFGLGSVLVVIDISSMSVSLFGPVLLLSFIIPGVYLSLIQTIVGSKQ